MKHNAPKLNWMRRTDNEERGRRELIVDTWIKSGRGPITAKLLRRIQRAISKGLGPHATPSPASIARVLADEGAELRHPEVIEFDARWRESKLKKAADSIDREPTAPLTFETAEALVARFENLRKGLQARNDLNGLRQLRDAAINEKAKAQLLSRDELIDESTRKVQEEIAEWFRVWLQTPELFNDWLDLRRRSREFRETFAAAKSTHEPSA